MRITAIRHSMFAAAVALSVIVAGSAITAAEPDKLMSRSRDASTAAEHAALAREFRLQADAFDAKAVDHEQHAARLAKNVPGMAHKWPAMALTSVHAVQQQAFDARRAAHESRALADHHVRLAVEQQVLR